MKLAPVKNTALAVSLFIASAFTAAAQDGKAKRSTEQQVLDRFAGEWKTVVTNKTAGTTGTSSPSRTWTRDGKGTVLHEESIDLATGAEFPALWRYYPEKRVYRFAMLMPNGWTTIDGTWDEKSATMTWKGKDAWGNPGSGIHRFIDKDNSEWTYVIKNPEGEMLADMSAKQTRLTAEDKKERAGAPVPKRTAEQEVLGHFVGEWRQSGETNGQASSSMGSISWSRGGKGTVIHHDGVSTTTGSESVFIWVYDPENKVYRHAFLFQQGWSVGEGQWDEKSQTMKWHKDTNSWGNSGSGSQRVIDKDHSEWTYVINNPARKVVMDLSGKISREK